MADRINRPNFDFTIKTTPLGCMFLAYQQEKDHNRSISKKTCALLESVWVWYGPALDAFDAEFMKFRVGTKPMNNVQRKQAERQIVAAIRTKLYEKQAERQKDKGKPYTTTTVNMFMRSLITWFRWLMAEGVMMFDHTEDLRKLKMAESKEVHRTILMPDQMEQYIAYKPKPGKFTQNRTWTSGLVLLDGGVRVEELCDLRLNDFWFRDELLDVQHGKGDKERRIHLSKAVIGPLLKYKSLFIDPSLDNPYFFGTRDGKRLSEDNFRRDLQILMTKAKITSPNGKKLTPHCFRHTNATAMLINTGDIHKVKQHLGHADIKTTEQYLHLVAEMTQGGKEEASALNPTGAFRLLSKKNTR